jgi:1D-myo-inositol-tetrakisphosphate 5-kinase/inositol-polyphosphate multikinase
VYLSSQGYRRPCVIDLKVGLRTYSERGHDSAYVAKRSAHDKRSGQFEVGFKVCGMQTWERSSMGSDENGGEDFTPENGGVNFKRARAARSGTKAYPDGWTRVTKPYSWARGLCSKSDARKALEEFVGMDSDDDDEDAQLCFLNDGGNGDASSAHSGDSHSNGDSSNEVPSCSSYDGSKNERSDARHPSRTKSGRDCGDSKLRRRTNRAKEVYGEALAQIGAMRAWFATQRELHLLGSSVLIVYEGDEGTGEGNDDAQLCHRSGPGVRVKAIDFCNYVEGAGELDTNFGAGLDRLSQMLESIVADS